MTVQNYILNDVTVTCSENVAVAVIITKNCPGKPRQSKTITGNITDLLNYYLITFNLTVFWLSPEETVMK